MSNQKLDSSTRFEFRRSIEASKRKSLSLIKRFYISSLEVFSKKKLQNKNLNSSSYTTFDEALEALSFIIVSKLKSKQSSQIFFHEMFENLKIEKSSKIITRVTSHRFNESREKENESLNFASTSSKASSSKQISLSLSSISIAIISLAKSKAHMFTTIRLFLNRKNEKKNSQEFLKNLE